MARNGMRQRRAEHRVGTMLCRYRHTHSEVAEALRFSHRIHLLIIHIGRLVNVYQAIQVVKYTEEKWEAIVAFSYSFTE